MVIQTRPIPDALQATADLPYPQFIQRVLLARHIHQAATLDYPLRNLQPVSRLRQVKEAAQLLADTIERKERILIVGDYDADGATATAVTIRALKMMGHSAVDFLVPDRFKYGYGLTPEIVKLAQAFDPHLLMTVDNGVSSIEGVEAARALGYKTLITDHHLPGLQLPNCDVMVNPNHPEDGFSSKCLAGVGVVFYVMLALKQELSQRGYFQAKSLPEPNLTSLLDLVALGTVADVVSLDSNNQILVEHGLRLIRRGQGKAGILALLEASQRTPAQVISSDFGFACGPRLNAAGRLADMSVGIRCLLTDDRGEANALASQLNTLNTQRKSIEADMKEEADSIMQSLGFDRHHSTLPPILCLHHPNWHEGVVGIVASRLKDRYYRPTIVFASAEDGLVKGSARCIKGLHMRDLIEEVSTRHPGLIQRFGGHAMAAGLTLKAEQLDTFKQAIELTTKRHVKNDTFQEVIYTDGVLEAAEMTVNNALLLRDLAPWGQDFPAPLFEGEFEIVRFSVLKEQHAKAELKPLTTLPHTNFLISAIQFRADLSRWPAIGETVRLLYTLNVNEYRGERNLQLMVDKVLKPH